MCAVFFHTLKLLINIRWLYRKIRKKNKIHLVYANPVSTLRVKLKIELTSLCFMFALCIRRHFTRRECLREILREIYKNIAIIAIQHSKMYFVDTFGNFSHTVQ